MNHRSYGSTSISEVVAGKPVIDATNPIADSPPVNGVLKFFTSLDESLMERLQREFADARLVRGQSFDGKPTMFICGNNEAANVGLDDVRFSIFAPRMRSV
jgi:hypothetical protein